MDSPSKKRKTKKTSGKSSSVSTTPSSKHRANVMSTQSTSGSVGSPSNSRQERDLPYFQRPTTTTSTLPQQPPLNSKFERPNTRSHGSSDLGSDNMEPEDIPPNASEISTSSSVQEPATLSLTSAQATTTTAGAPPTEQLNESEESSDTQSKDDPHTATTDLVHGTGSGGYSHTLMEADKAGFGLHELVSTPAKSTAQAATPPNFEATSAPTCTKASTSGATATSGDPTGKATVQSAATIVADDSRSTPSPIIVSATLTTANHMPTPETPVPIPAQIAIVEASPSKRVAFSPNKQESRLSNPSMAPFSKLKGILKPAPLRMHDIGGDIDSVARNVFPGGISSDKLNNIGHLSDAESFVKTALLSLESDDLQLRATAYMGLQAKFREGDEKPYLDEVRESIRMFAAYFLRDLDLGNPPSLVQATLRCTSYYLFNHSIVAMFTAKEIESLVAQLLELINTTNEKPTCNLSIWTLSSARIAPRLLTPFVPQLIQAFLENLDSRFKSSSITSESLGALFSLFTLFPGEILPNVQLWLIPVLMRLVANIPGIRSRALELLTMAIPKLIEKEDSRRVQIVSKFMKEYSSDFFGLLTQNFLDVGDEVYAITVWGAMVTLIGRALQKSPSLNPMLKMAEKCFNSTSSRRTEIKMAAFQAWTRLIYNFAIGGHIANEKPLRLILTPIKNCFLTERHKRIRLACANAWIAMIYALGHKLTKNAEHVLFPQLKLVIVDESEHIRDLTLRLLVALFSNSGGQELVEGRQSIVPGSITFADLGLTDANWVRTDLLDHGLHCIYQTICLQHKIRGVNREEWRRLGLTELPLLTQRCARTWESIVKAIRDINLQEKGMKATPEADRAVSSLLLFIDKISHCDPKALVPGEWPDSDQEKISLMKNNPDMAGFIVRADIVHYFYACVIDIFSARSLVTARYRVQDKIHIDLYDAINSPKLEPTSQASEVARPSQTVGAAEVTLSPLEFILKSWLATGESVIGTALEDPFWQAVAFFVEVSTKGVRVLRPLYRCLDHMEDIKAKRQTTSTHIWPTHSNGPAAPLSFRVFQCKYWAIIAQRLGVTIDRANEISDDAAADQHGYDEFFDFVTYPFKILNDSCETRSKVMEMDHSQRVSESQDDESAERRIQFMDTFEATSLPAWTGLLCTFYKVAQHKRGNANMAMNALAGQIREQYDPKSPFVWTQSLSLAYASAIVESMLVVDSRTSLLKSSGAMLAHSPHRDHSKENFNDLLDLCSFLFEQAYTSIEKTRDLTDNTQHIPALQGAAFLLMEKIINKAPLSLMVSWLQRLQRSIIFWIDDPLMHLRNLVKANRKPYRARVDVFWGHCVLRKLLGYSTQSSVGRPRSGFGSVLPGPASTIRGALQSQKEKAQSPTSLVNPFLESQSDSSESSPSKGFYDSDLLARLTPLLFAALNSHRKSIVNKTLEFWNQTFGLSKTDLEYPEDIVSIMQQLKLVATISLPGWTAEDSSLTEIPQFASLSQDMLSMPAELNMRSPSGLSRLLREKAEVARQLSPRRQMKRNLESVLTFDSLDVQHTPMNDSTASSNNTSRAVTPSPISTPTGSRPHTPTRSNGIGVSTDESSTPIKKPSSSMSSPSTKRKKSRTVHTLAIDPVKKILIGRTSEISSGGSNTPEDSADEVEVSSPSKRVRKAAVMQQKLPKGQGSLQGAHQRRLLPAAPVWRLEPLLRPCGPTDDSPSSPRINQLNVNPTLCLSASMAPTMEGVDQEAAVSADAQISSAAVEQQQPEAFKIQRRESIACASEEVVTGVRELGANLASMKEAQDMEVDAVAVTPLLCNAVDKCTQEAVETESKPTSMYFTAGSEESKSISVPTSGVEAVSPLDVEEGSRIQKTEDQSTCESKEISAFATASATAPVHTPSMTAQGSIATGEEFSRIVQRLVEARQVVAHMDMRQLFELQNQLMTLNQAVCGGWGQLMQGGGDDDANQDI